MQSIQGFTPEMLWTTIIVVVGLGALFIEYDKIRTIFKNRKKERQEEEQTHDNGFRQQLTEDIATKVMEKLEPRLSGIESKLENDKNRLDNHEDTISTIKKSNEVIAGGLEVTCNALVAVLDHELHNGNSDQMQKARDDLQHYTNSLIGRVSQS